MKRPALHKNEYDKESVLRLIKELSHSYTPEWRMRDDLKEPGSVLAFLFADMQWRTMNMYSRLPEKMYRELCDRTGASRRPSLPAQGYVCFDYASEGEGKLIPEGTTLSSARLAENELPVPVTVKEDVYVSGVRPEAIYYADRESDSFFKVYDRRDSEEIKDIKSPVGSDGNLNEHKLFLCHPYLLSGSRECILTVCAGDKAEYEILKKTRFFYDTEEGAEEFIKSETDDGRLVLRRSSDNAPVKAEDTPEGAERGEAGYRLTLIPERSKEEIRLKDISFGGYSRELPPDRLIVNGTETGEEILKPFGMRYSRFDELCIFSEDVLSKKRAEVTLKFMLSFEALEADYEESGTKWKLIMKKSDIKTVKEYDITVNKVVWEYFNGTGWASLFKSGEYSDIFRIDSSGAGGELREVKFVCPSDITPVTTGGAQGHSIRIRIAEINNEFKTTGRFIYPVMTDVKINYKYTDNEAPQSASCMHNGNFYEDMDRRKGYLLNLPLECGHKCFYIGYDAPLPSYGTNMLLVMEKTGKRAMPQIRYSYSADKGFKETDVIDGTENLRRTGILSFTKTDGAKRRRLFGRDLFWIRAEDAQDGYLRKDGAEFPCIKEIFMNAVRAETVRRDIEEYFTDSSGEPDLKLKLMYGDVRNVRVRISEKNIFSKEELKDLERERRFRPEKKDGRVFVEWLEKKTLKGAGGDERAYVCDRKDGEIIFGDGAEGRLPSSDTENGIWIKYDTGGGSCCNLAEYEVTGLEYTDPEIGRAYNPLPFCGGADAETVEQAMERKSYELHSLKKPVSINDFEMAAMSAAPYARLVKGFKGMNERGEKEPGTITLVVLPKKEESPDSFERYKEKLFALLERSVGINLVRGGRIRVTEPDFLRTEIRADVLISDYHKAYRVKKDLAEALTECLRESAGGIGSLPSKNEILMKMQSVKDVEEIRYLTVGLKTVGEEKETEMNLKAASKLPYAVAVPGEFILNIKTEWQS